MTKDQITRAAKDSIFGKNLYKYVEFCSWCRWYPDLFLDLIHPKTGGIKLHSDQRVYLRAIMRFVSVYGVFPRGWSKTYNEYLAMFLVGIFFPGIDLAMTAQTKENAAELISDKHKEILKHFPMLANELKEKERFSKGEANVVLKSDSTIDNLANAQSSKGQRRKRINIEESALLNNELFQDALKPIVEVPRYTVGKLGIVDPCELNQQINFFTTSGFRGTDEYERNLNMYKNMVNLQGEMVLGSSWFLACWYGRGSSKSQILKKKKEMSPIAFAQNYESKWVGCADNALVNINKVMNCRSLTSVQTEAKINDEIYMGVDVARSQKSSNNQSSICIVKVQRSKDRKQIISVDLLNVINIPNILNFSTQAVIVKQVQKQYNAQMVVMDGNGLGAGLIDECLKSNIDPHTSQTYPCWNTLNDDNMPEDPDNAETILFNLKAQGSQTKIITNFIDMINSGKLRLLTTKRRNEFSEKDNDDFDNKIKPFLETENLIEEIANLRLKQSSNGALQIEQVVKRINKDRVSALMYVLWYINEFCKNSFMQSEYEFACFSN